MFRFQAFLPLAKRLRIVPNHRCAPSRNCNLLACSQTAKPANQQSWQTQIQGGSRQSPIDIRSSESVHDPQLTPLSISYDPSDCLQIWNNGDSFLVEFDDSKDNSVVSGGPLENHYKLKQFHFHWGAENNRGSEHTINSLVYPAELHLVHWNAEKFRTFDEAIFSENGLAVIGVFLKLGRKHDGLQKLVNALPAVKYKDSTVEFSNFNPSCMIPSCLDYWTYPGSLTTPPQTESVTWVIMKKPIEFGDDQLSAFRSLLFTPFGEKLENMVDNFRQQQPLMNRVVRATILQ
uniref:Carbonic anhydrase n=1 Tax=Callorhinchus milii TaxID=7868 RepID=V9KZC2_CALMI